MLRELFVSARSAKLFSVTGVLVLAIGSCNLPTGQAMVAPATESLVAEPAMPPAADTPLPLPTETASAIPSAANIVISITASGGNINIRRGPAV